MVNKSLACHSDTESSAVWSIHVNVEPKLQGDLHLSYELTGDLAQIRIPAPQLTDPVI